MGTSASPPASIALRIQRLPMADQVLGIARLAEARSESNSLSAGSIETAFDDLGLPRPGKISNPLSVLKRQGLIAQPKGKRGVWRFTPKGVERVTSLIDEMDIAALTAEASTECGSTLGKVAQTVLPPWLAPPEVLGAVRSFVAEYPFERNVFGMTRFPIEGEDETALSDPVESALVASRDACADHGLTFHLASDRLLVDDLWPNVFAHMWGSRYGIALFENTVGQGMNYNLTIEVGSMLTLGRRTALLRDKSIDRLPTDLVGKVYKDVDLSKSSSVQRQVHVWIRDDLGLGPCGRCPP